ncbi:hypothetical protein HTG_04550 [Natrinema mahii]|nr:hypothetical protein HTG_04550 [Natrinema mahii]
MTQEHATVTIHSAERGVSRKLVDSGEEGYQAGETSKEFEDGSELVYEGTYIQKDVGVAEIVEFSLYVGETLAEGYAVHHIIQKLEDTDFRLTINGDEVEPNEESIQTKLEEFKE